MVLDIFLFNLMGISLIELMIDIGWWWYFFYLLVLLMYFRLCANKDESYQRRKSPTEPHRLFRSRTMLKRFKRTSFERKSFFNAPPRLLHFTPLRLGRKILNTFKTGCLTAFFTCFYPLFHLFVRGFHVSVRLCLSWFPADSLNNWCIQRFEMHRIHFIVANHASAKCKFACWWIASESYCKYLFNTLNISLFTSVFTVTFRHV